MNRVLLSRPFLHILRRNMSTPATSSSAKQPTGAKYKPSDFQKYILVWTKKYKSKQDIPEFVSLELIERSRSEARIKIANVLMLLTALASFGAILSGKAAAKRGESVHQMNLDWHKQYKDEYKEEKAVTK